MGGKIAIGGGSLLLLILGLIFGGDVGNLMPPAQQNAGPPDQKSLHFARKVLGTTETWAEKNPETLKALIKALLEACQWLDEPGNRAEAARLLASPRYLNTPAEVISRTLDLPDFHVFHRNHANFPWRSHADWFLKQMVRWGQVSPSIDIEATSDRVYRTDLFRAAANEMGIACPATDRLPPGGHGEPLAPAFEPIQQEFPALLRSGD
jgi:hypothetical protein